ncbi:MAG: carboxymuconolactone decarboxylase family protein [Pseudohaliea sp.]
MVEVPSALIALQPATSSAYQRAADTVLPLVDPRLLALCRARLQATQQRAVRQAPADCTDTERQALALAEQFAVDVNGISEAQVAALGEAMGAGAVNALVNSLYLVDMALRLQQVAPVVLAGSGEAARAGDGMPAAEAAGDSEAVIAEVIAGVIAAFAAQAVLADAVDPLTSELVRLRCAQVHHCRLCGSLRQRSALDNGFEESMAERVARYEQGGFTDAQVAALHLVDTLILVPADAGPALREELERHYSPGEIAELCFDVVKWSQQKALVATHSDAPPWEGIHVLDFDGDGHPLFTGPVAGATRP